MKSTYKLIGVHWDGLPQGGLLPERIPFDEEVLDLRYPRNLFDREAFRRAIALSLIFSLRTREEVDRALLRASACSELYIVVDCEPAACGDVPSRFFERRTRQAFCLARRLLAGVEVGLMDGPSESCATLSRGTAA